jgi:hypothetical protein
MAGKRDWLFEFDSDGQNRLGTGVILVPGSTPVGFDKIISSKKVFSRLYYAIGEFRNK